MRNICLETRVTCKVLCAAKSNDLYLLQLKTPVLIDTDIQAHFNDWSYYSQYNLNSFCSVDEEGWYATLVTDEI